MNIIVRFIGELIGDIISDSTFRKEKATEDKIRNSKILSILQKKIGVK